MAVDDRPLLAMGHVVAAIGGSSGGGGGGGTKTLSAVSKSSTSTHPDICRACLLPIFDAYMLQVEGEGCYHERCASHCGLCGNSLLDVGRCVWCGNSRIMLCFEPVCREWSGRHCSGCLGPIGVSQLVRLIGNGAWHVECARCCVCSRQTASGSAVRFSAQGGGLVCVPSCESQHSDANHMADSRNDVSSFGENGEEDDELKTLQMMATGSRQKPAMKRELDDGDDDNSPTGQTSANLDEDWTAVVAAAAAVENHQLDGLAAFASLAAVADDDEARFLRRRGPRTTIKQHQLDVLNRIFATQPKPSKHARAKLAMETGLSMRVIQVWFQNRRSKERRLKHLCNYLRHYEQRVRLGSSAPAGSTSAASTSAQEDEMAVDQSVDSDPLLATSAFGDTNPPSI